MNRQIARFRCFLGWDYTKDVSLFIMIAKAPRRPLFGNIALIPGDRLWQGDARGGRIACRLWS